MPVDDQVFTDSDEEDIIPLSKAAADGLSQAELDEQQILNRVNVPTMNKSTRRLAVVNLDWDTVTCHDIMRILSAFKPKDGIIMSVAIYQSLFGQERMAVEESQGPPREIFKDTPADAEIDDNEPMSVGDDDDELIPDGKDLDASGFDEVALRKYQMERLRYYYAIVEMDSRKTASVVYKQCDQLEFEHSALKMDLRYVPEEDTFDDQVPRESCTAEQYQALGAKVNNVDIMNKMNAVNSMGYSSLKCTWDEDRADRKVMRRKWTKDELKDMDFSAYLASDSADSDASGDD